MKKRKTVDYKKVFSKLKSEAKKINIDLKPCQIMTDMELGAMNAFKYHWPNAVLKVCLFHVGQAFFKNFVKHGFKVLYETDKNIRSWFHKVFIMALIPLESIESFWINNIMPAMTLLSGTYPKIEGFAKYIIDNYFEGSFPMKCWNHFLTVGNRTNNHVEGYNLKLKKWIVAKSPNIFKAIKFFQKEELNSALKYARANSDDPKINKPPHRKHLNLEKEANLNLCKDLLKDGSISLEVYIEKTVAFYDFYRKPPVEEDSDVSDELSSDSSSDESE